MNRMILLLNVVVMVVTFLLALSATESQIGLLKSASATANAQRIPRRAGTEAAGGTTVLRLVQALGNISPEAQEDLTREQLAAIETAVRRYREVVANGVARALADTESTPARACRDAATEARDEVERSLGAAFRDPTIVSRLTTEIIRDRR